MHALTQTYATAATTISFDGRRLGETLPSEPSVVDRASSWLGERAQALREAFQPGSGGEGKQREARERSRGGEGKSAATKVDFSTLAGSVTRDVAGSGSAPALPNLSSASAMLQNTTMGLLDQLQASGQQYLKSTLALPNGAQLQFVMRVAGETVQLRVATDDASLRREFAKGWDKLTERAARNGITLDDPEIVAMPGESPGEGPFGESRRQPYQLDPEVA